MKRLFFFDIDGTLIDCEKGIYDIHEEVINSLNKLKESGHNVFLATGRCKCFIVDGVMKYPFDGYVTCNGACVEYKGKTVYKKIIPTHSLKAVHDFCLKHNCAYYFENNEWIYVLNKDNPKHLLFKDEWGMKDEVIVDEFNIDEIECYIGMIVLNDESQVPLMNDLLGGYFNIQRHVAGLSFDLTLKDESKLHGIEELSQYLDVAIQDTVAFGDARNDIEMLSGVGKGIAMGNGTKEAKEAADYITTSIHDHGIVNALKYWKYIS